MLMALSPDPTSERPFRCNPCSCSRRSFAGQLSAEEKGALAHPAMAVRSGTDGMAIETPPSIFDLDSERVMVCEKMHSRLWDPGMSRNVGQGFLHNPEGC